MRLGVARAISEGALVEGDVEIDGGMVSAVGISPAGPGGIAVPGFVDMQVNGFAGVDFTTATAKDYATAGAAMLAGLLRAALDSTRPTAAEPHREQSSRNPGPAR